MDWRRFWEWILFGVGVGSVPVLARFFVEYPGRPSWSIFLSHGDLLIVSVVLCGAGIGRLLMSSQSEWGLKGAIGCVCVVLLGLATWQYAAFCSSGPPSVDVAQWVATTALMFLGLSAVSTSIVMGMP